jgi:hypothetical protein
MLDPRHLAHLKAGVAKAGDDVRRAFAAIKKSQQEGKQAEFAAAQKSAKELLVRFDSLVDPLLQSARQFDDQLKRDRKDGPVILKEIADMTAWKTQLHTAWKALSGMPGPASKVAQRGSAKF